MMRTVLRRLNVCRKVLEKWLGPADNWEEEFDSIDMTNKKGEDAVLFVVIDQSAHFKCLDSRSFGEIFPLIFLQKNKGFLGLTMMTMSH